MNPDNQTQENNFPLIPPNHYFSPLKKRSSHKSIIKKYYGRKIIFVGKKTHFTAAMNRSKYFLRFEIYNKAIPASSFKCLANIIFFNMDIFLKYHLRGYCRKHACYPNIHPFQLKKALRSCKNPKPESPQLQHLQHLFHLKSLTLQVTTGSSMSKASKVIRKLRFLESFHVKYLADMNESDPNLLIKLRVKPPFSDPDDERGWGFFYKISKLPRLQRLILKTSLRTLEGQSSVVQQDFTDFCLSSHPFKIETEVYTNSSLDIQELAAKSMASMLRLADSLSLHMGVWRPAKKNPYMCQDPQKKKMRFLKQGDRQVKFFVFYKEKLQVNIGYLLTRCENLVFLYLQTSGIEVLWDQDYESFPHKLQTVVLNLDSLGLKYEILGATEHPKFYIEEKIYEIADGGKVKFHSGLLELLKQLKRRAVGLETLTLFMCLASFKKSWLQPKSFKELYEKIVEGKTREFFEELEFFEKFQRIDICKKTGYLDECLNRVLTAKRLKKVCVRSFCDNL